MWLWVAGGHHWTSEPGSQASWVQPTGIPTVPIVTPDELSQLLPEAIVGGTEGNSTEEKNKSALTPKRQVIN